MQLAHTLLPGRVLPNTYRRSSVNTSARCSCSTWAHLSRGGQATLALCKVFFSGFGHIALARNSIELALRQLHKNNTVSTEARQACVQESNLQLRGGRDVAVGFHDDQRLQFVVPAAHGHAPRCVPGTKLYVHATAAGWSCRGGAAHCKLITLWLKSSPRRSSENMRRVLVAVSTLTKPLGQISAEKPAMASTVSVLSAVMRGRERWE